MTTNDRILNGSGLSTVLGLLKLKIDEKADSSSIVTPVQSDWAQSITTSLDYIKNKPILPENNILSYYGKSSSMAGGDNQYYLLATDIADGTTHVYNVPAYTTTPTNDNQMVSKSYLDLALTPYALTSALSPVAFSGSYNDLEDKPTIQSISVTQGLTTGNLVGTITIDGETTSLYAPQPEQAVQSNWNEADSSAPSFIQNKPSLATVATTGAYSDLTGTPDLSDYITTAATAGLVSKDYADGLTAGLATEEFAIGVTAGIIIPTNVSAFTNDAGYITSAATSGLATESFAIAVTSGLSTVATSGSYNDLADKPTIITPIQSDWNNSDTTSLAYIQNKPTGLATETYVDTAISTAIGGIIQFSYEVTPSLPATGETGTIYLVAHTHGTGDVYDEYLWINSDFEKIGSTDIDLTGYVQKSEVVPALTTGIQVADISGSTIYIPQTAEGFYKVTATSNPPSIGSDTYSSLKSRLDNNQVVYLQKDGVIYHWNSADSTKLTFRNIGIDNLEQIDINSDGTVTFTDLSAQVSSSVFRIPQV